MMNQSINLVQVIVSYNCNKDCNYCYAKEQKENFSDMSIKNFIKILNWFQGNNIHRFNLLGGEPTIHPLIHKFTELAHRRGFKFSIFSNGLFPSQKIIHFKNVQNFLINYHTKSHYTPQEYKLLHQNLTNIHKENINISLAFNITQENNSCQHIIDAAKRYKIKRINLDFIQPSSFKSNIFIKKDVLNKKKNILFKFIEELKKEDLYVRITRPLPICLFTKEEIRKLKKNNFLYFQCQTGSSTITINPDLSVYPCLSIFFKGPKLTSFKQVKDYVKFYKKAIYQLKWKKFLYPKCQKCIYRIRHQCQGMCLCHKLKRFYIYNDQKFIIYSQYSLEKIKDFIKIIKRSIFELESMFNPLQKKIKIYLFDNSEDLKNYSGVYFFPKWVKGFASYNFHLYLISPKSTKRLTHELCHLYLNNLNKSKSPTWLNEGMCEYVNFKEDNTKNLLELMKNKKIFSFKELSKCGKLSLLKYDKDPLDKNICYQQSHNFVRFLIKKFGEKKVLDLLSLELDNFFEGFERITKQKFSQIEKEWLDQITRTNIK